LALAALALVVFGAYDSYPKMSSQKYPVLLIAFTSMELVWKCELFRRGAITHDLTYRSPRGYQVFKTTNSYSEQQSVSG